MRILILANGDPPSGSLARRLVAEHDLFLATDGAAHRAAGLGLTPDIVCGDFDSVQLEVARAEFPRAAFVPTPDQERADLEKALHIALDRGAATLTIMGAGGGRIDFLLANFALLLRYHTDVPLLRIVDDQATVWAVSGPDEAPGALTFPATSGDTVSLLSFDGAAHVTLTGTRWPLFDERLPIGTRGMSNVATADQVTVQARGGAVLVCHLLPQKP